MINLGDRLKELRKEKKYTQNQIAKIFNIGQTTWAGYEKNKSRPDLDTLIKLADFFNVTTDYLLGQTNMKLSIDQMTLLKEIDLSNNNLFEKYDLTIDGKSLSKEEFLKAIELIRVMKK
jgi:transcriptional regulator with XRE-family HTH domain